MTHEPNVESRLEALGARARADARAPFPDALAAHVRASKARRALRAHRRWVRSASWACAWSVVLLGAVALGVYLAQRRGSNPAPRLTPPSPHAPVLAHRAEPPTNSVAAHALMNLERLNRRAATDEIRLPDPPAGGGLATREPVIRAGMGMLGGW